MVAKARRLMDKGFAAGAVAHGGAPLMTIAENDGGPGVRLRKSTI